MRKYTQDQVRNIFANGKCELLDVYSNAQIPVTYRCSCGYISDIRINDFINGTRCKKCMTSATTPFKHEDIQKLFEEHGCTLLTQYKRDCVKVQFKCKCGYISCVQVSAYKRQNYQCVLCGYNQRGLKMLGSANFQWHIDRIAIEQKAIFAKRAKTLLENTLARIGKSKEGHTNEILGYSAQELMAHLQSFDTWEELQNKNWHIDHKFPVIAFIEHGITDLAIINSLDNLRPLLGSSNCSKGDWYDEECFLSYCKKHGLAVEKKLGSDAQTLLKEAK